MKAKFYKGISVLTKKEAAEVLAVTEDKIYRQVRKTWLLKEGVDFFQLKGQECYDFKTEYAIESRGSSIILLTQTGLKKIKRYIKEL